MRSTGPAATRAQHDRHSRRQFADVRRQPRRRAHGFDDRALIAQLRQRAQRAPVVVQPDAQQGDRGFVQSRGRDAGPGSGACCQPNRRNWPSWIVPSGPAPGERKADGRVVWVFCTCRAAWASSPGPPACRVRRRPARRPRSRPRAGWTDRPRPAPGRRAWRPSTTGSVLRASSSRAKAVSSMVSVPCTTTAPWQPRSKPSAIASDRLARSRSVSVAPGLFE